MRQRAGVVVGVVPAPWLLSLSRARTRAHLFFRRLCLCDASGALALEAALRGGHAPAPEERHALRERLARLRSRRLAAALACRAAAAAAAALRSAGIRL